jgi:hypothetical protein
MVAVRAPSLGSPPNPCGQTIAGRVVNLAARDVDIDPRKERAK